MKKSLFIYYSLEGNTEYVASQFQKYAGVDIEKLVPVKEPPKSGFGKFLQGGKSALFKDKVELRPLMYNIEDYRDVIIGCPVWAGTFPPAIGAYLREHKPVGKLLYLVGCSSGGKAQGMFKKIQEELQGCQVISTLSLREPLKDKEEAEHEIRVFCEKYLVSPEEGE